MRLIREDWKRNKQTAPSSLNSSSEKVVLSTPSSESAASLFGADYLALYVRGTLATNIRVRLLLGRVLRCFHVGNIVCMECAVSSESYLFVEK